VTERQLAGVFVPVTTPFDPVSGDPVLGPFRNNVARHLTDGAAGIVVAGSTGEAPLLDREEFCRLVQWARATVPADRWLIAGTGAESTRQAIALSRTAAAEGADLVIVRPPGYFSAGHSRDSLADYYRAVADASPVPVLVYNIPKYTHLPLSPDLLALLATHERIVGVKDSSGDSQNLAAYRAAVPEWAVLAGSASLLASALRIGCAGGVVAVACFAARACVELYEAARTTRDESRLSALQQRLAAADKEIVGRFGPAGVKAAMDAAGQGLYGGPVRPPLAPLSAADRQRVTQIVAGD
jgi:4-hydroxy-2-oxoglutarate aldolase